MCFTNLNNSFFVWLQTWMWWKFLRIKDFKDFNGFQWISNLIKSCQINIWLSFHELLDTSWNLKWSIKQSSCTRLKLSILVILCNLVWYLWELIRRGVTLNHVFKSVYIFYPSYIFLSLANLLIFWVTNFMIILNINFCRISFRVINFMIILNIDFCRIYFRL